MGLDIMDLFFRLERNFGIRISRPEIAPLFREKQPPDILVGDLLEFLRRKSPTGVTVLDDETDAELIWSMLRHTVSDALGVEPGEVTKDRWIIHDLGA